MDPAPSLGWKSNLRVPPNQSYRTGLGYEAAPTSHREPPGDPSTQPTPQQTPLPATLPAHRAGARFLCSSGAGERGPPTRRPGRRTPRVPADVGHSHAGLAAPRLARLPPDCPPVSNPSAVTNLWGGRLGAGDSWEAGGVAWGLRRVSLGPRSPPCQSHCLWAQCCCGADAPPPPPHAPARAPPRSALGPAYLSSGSHHFCNSPRPREFRSSPRPSPSPPTLQPSAKPGEPPSSVSGDTTPSSRPEPQRSLRGPPRVCPYLGTLVHPGWDPEVPTHIPRFSLWGQGSHVLQSRATA